MYIWTLLSSPGCISHSRMSGMKFLREEGEFQNAWRVTAALSLFHLLSAYWEILQIMYAGISRYLDEKI